MKVAAIHIAPGRRLPCRLMDDGIGPGAAAARRGRAGSVFRIVASGIFGVGDTVEIAEP